MGITWEDLVDEGIKHPYIRPVLLNSITGHLTLKSIDVGYSCAHVGDPVGSSRRVFHRDITN